MFEATYDWTQFSKQIFIDADPETVFQAWAIPERLVSWFIAEARYTSAEGRERSPNETIVPDDTYWWRWHQAYEERGRVLSIGPGLTMQFTFGEEANKALDPIVVSVTCHEDDGKTRLELIQANIPDSPTAQHSWHMGCCNGWSFFMTNLKARLEYGIDLRETDPQRAYTSRAINA